MSRRVIPNLYIAVHEETEFESIQDNHTIRDIIFNSIILGVGEAIKYKRKEATIVELNSSGNYVTLPKEIWKQSLESAQQHFVKLEEYETCADIQELIESIESYGTKRLYRKTPRTDKSNNRGKKHLKAS
jgi:hypothetical protein